MVQTLASDPCPRLPNSPNAQFTSPTVQFQACPYLLCFLPFGSYLIIALPMVAGGHFVICLPQSSKQAQSSFHPPKQHRSIALIQAIHSMFQLGVRKQKSPAQLFFQYGVCRKSLPACPTMLGQRTFCRTANSISTFGHVVAAAKKDKANHPIGQASLVRYPFGHWRCQNEKKMLLHIRKDAGERTLSSIGDASNLPMWYSSSNEIWTLLSPSDIRPNQWLNLQVSCP
jgi:hypothetical protein